MKRVMIVGAVDSGKTSLLLAMNGESKRAVKTQTINFNSYTIDTPGEYMENPGMYRALMSTSQQAKCIMFTQDSTSNKSIFPPGFARAFNCMSIGIITKIDHPSSNVKRAEKFLSQLCLRGMIFKVSAFTGEGLEDLIKSLNFDIN